MKITLPTVLRRSCLLGLMAALATSVGCSEQETGELSFGAVSRDLTPELQTTTERPVDVDRHLAVMKNVEGRSFWDDLGRTFYTDHPSRLSPYPVTSTSGQPR